MSGILSSSLIIRLGLFGAGFFEGAALMGLEVAAPRFIAPWFGNSIYVWAAVLFTSLLALAGGYLAGGFVRNKSKGSLLVLYFGAAALYFLIIPLAGKALADWTVRFDLIPGLILTALLLFAPCFFLLGSISPLLAAFLANYGDPGVITGKLFAASTLGGVIMALLAGWILIPMVGTSETLILLGVLMFMGLILVQPATRNATINAEQN